MSLNKIILSITFATFFFDIHPITIMIDPIGDATYTGREIEDVFERSLTLQCAYKLKEKIEATCAHTEVIITRNAGQTLQQYQNASFANRMHVDLYLCLGLYYQQNIPGNITIYYNLENSLDLQHIYNPCYFYHISQAYLANITTSKKIAQKLYALCRQKNNNPHFLCLGAFGIPCMPLFGIQPPAVYIEAGLHHKDDWNYLIQPILDALKEINYEKTVNVW